MGKNLKKMILFGLFVTIRVIRILKNKMNVIILAKGEKSSRLNLDKAFLKIKGKTLIALLLEKTKSLFNKIYIVTVSPEKFKIYESEKIKIVKDDLKCGPIGGIYTGLKESDSVYNFVLAVDQVFVDKEMISYMMEKEKNYQVLIPKTGDFIQPLCGIYTKSVLDIIERKIKKGKYKLSKIFDEVMKTEYLEKELEQFGNPEILFFNLNTEKDLAEVRGCP